MNETQTTETASKPVRIDGGLHKDLLEISEQSGVPAGELANRAIRPYVEAIRASGEVTITLPKSETGNRKPKMQRAA